MTALGTSLDLLAVFLTIYACAINHYRVKKLLLLPMEERRRKYNYLDRGQRLNRITVAVSDAIIFIVASMAVSEGLRYLFSLKDQPGLHTLMGGPLGSFLISPLVFALSYGLFARKLPRKDECYEAWLRDEIPDPETMSWGVP